MHTYALTYIYTYAIACASTYKHMHPFGARIWVPDGAPDGGPDGAPDDVPDGIPDGPNKISKTKFLPTPENSSAAKNRLVIQEH